MILGMSHTCIYVVDIESALDFYVKKLGLTIKTDAKWGDIRWVTLISESQPDLEYALKPIVPGMDSLTKESAPVLRKLVQGGHFSFGVFKCDDIEKTYKELLAKGVEFIKAPTKEVYGISAVFIDDSGNFFSLNEGT